MHGPIGSGPVISRIGGGGAPEGLFDAGHGAREVLSCDWGGVHLFQARAEAIELPEAVALNHLVGLHLSGSTGWHANVAGGGWQAHRTPVHAVSVMPQGVPFAAYTGEPSEVVVVEIAPDVAAAALGANGPGTVLRPAIGVQDAFAKHVMLALAEEARTGREFGALRAESLVGALVSHLGAGSAQPLPVQAAGLPSPKLRRVLDYVAAHIEQPLTLRNLSDLLEMDQFRFIRAFKLSTGLSPHRYVLEARIGRAKQLLASRAMSIGDIALETGFATPSHFSVTFRRLTGITPREYRDGL